MATKDGGRAFPQALPIEHEFVGSEGMTLRDYFAAAALNDSMHRHGDVVRAAQYAYKVADAMLEEREKQR